jgi:hypothetical protein
MALRFVRWRTGARLQVLLNGNKLPITSFQKYCDMYAPSRRRPRGNETVCGGSLLCAHAYRLTRRRIVAQFIFDSHSADHAAPIDCRCSFAAAA